MRSWGNASASGGVGKSGGGVKTGGARMRVARSGFGASSSLPNAPAKVPLLCDLPTFVMVDWGARALPWRAA